MLDHLALQVTDVDAAAAFYVEVFATLDVRELMRFPVRRGRWWGSAVRTGSPTCGSGPWSTRGCGPCTLH